jgi:tetratricopeptide (TPR) repeat protein
MKPRKILIILSIVFAQKLFAQNTVVTVEQAVKKVEAVFKNFINDDRTKSDLNLLICKDFNKLFLENKADTIKYLDVIVKKNIVELFSYCNIKYQDYNLILTPPQQKKLFDSLVKNIADVHPNTNNNMYAYAVTGYYLENIQRDFLSAEFYYKKAFESGVPYPILLSWRSWNYFRGNDRIKTMNEDSAITWIKNCIAAKPRYAIAYVCLGHLTAFEGDTLKAYSYFYKALQLNPDLKTAHIAYAFWYEQRAMLDSAIRYYEKIIVKYPRFISALANLAADYKTKKSKKFYNKAISVYKKCIAIDSLESSYYENIAEIFVYNLGQYDSALYYYKEAVKLNPAKVYLLGSIYKLKHDYKTAIKYYTEYEKINPSGLLYYFIGDCYTSLSADNIPKAIANYKKSIDLDSTMESSYEALGLVYNSLFKYDSSIYYYNKLIEVNRKKSYVADMGFPYRNYANEKMNTDSNYYEAYKILADGARKRNRGCLAMCFALQYEFGYDDSEIDFEQAKAYYLKAVKLWPFSKLGVQGILRLYEKNKIAVSDSIDYKSWKSMDTAVTKSRYWQINTYSDTVKNISSIRILSSYPNGVHPAEWERERLKEDYGLLIKNSDYEDIGRQYLASKDEGKSFTDFSVSRADAKYSAEIDTLTKSNEQRADEQTINNLTDKWEQRVKLKSDDEDVKFNASEAYRINSLQYFDSKNYEKAIQMANRGLDLYPYNKKLIRLLCEILVISGRNEEAFVVYDNYRYATYFTDDKITFREMFLTDMESMEKKFNGSTTDIQKSKLYLYSAKEKLIKNLATYQDVMASGDAQLIFDAANYFAESWNTDSLLKSFSFYEKLTGLKDSAVYYNNYLNALAKLKDVANDEKYNPAAKSVDVLFSKSNYTDLEKLLLKWRMRSVKEPDFEQLFNAYINKLAAAEYWADLMYNAKNYKAVAKDSDNPNKSTLLFVARKAIDLYYYINKNMPSGYKKYKELTQLIAQRCGEFSYTIILLKDYEYALKAALLAHKTDSTEEYSKTNLPIAYLLTGNFEKARSVYLEFKDQKFSDGRFFKEIFLSDIDDLTKKGILKK